MKSVFIILLSFSFYNVFCQQPYYHQFHQADRITNIQSTGYSGTGANIDVKYHKLSWRINPDSTIKYIKGFVQTNFVATQNNITTITFDLNAVLTVDSVLFRASKLPAGNITRSGNILSINLGAVLPLNTLDSVWIYYQGTPPSPSGSATGFTRVNTVAAGNYITTLSESYEDRDWWPCKADMQDKIDSVDIIVNVPWASPTVADTFWVASNGVLTDSTITGSNRNFIYKTRYPIASYLVCVSVGRFGRYYSNPVNINGTLVPVVFYLLTGKTATSLSNDLIALEKMSLVLQEFSNKFGDYPFKLEKHGYYDGLAGAGGMEHQTFSGIAINSLTSLRTLAHELMHQWFGDNVTMSTWNDLWLAEGFARYSEALAGELVPSLGINPYTTRNGFKNSALSLSTTSLWIPDASIANSNTIWSSNYGSAVYERGAMIVSMLRTFAGDNIFFNALTNYQTSIGGSTATADSVKNHFNSLLGQNLTPFFDDYVGGSGNGATAVGGKGNPVYSINWANPSGTQLIVKVASQAQTIGSNVSYFRSPVVLHVKGALAAEDTTITFFDWGSGNLSYAGNGLSAPVPGNELSYNLSFIPLTVAFDDSARTLSTGSTTKIFIIPVHILSFTAIKNGTANRIDLSLENASPIDKVELLRSGDGIDYTKVGDMSITATQPYRFNFNDQQPFYPVTYYQAKIYYNGHVEFTNIVSVTSVLPNNILIVPNPVRHTALIRFSNPLHSLNTIRLFSTEGKLIKEYISADSQISADVSSLSSGIYIVQQLSNGLVMGTTKLVVAR